MADEITVTLGMRLANGLLSVNVPNTTTQFDQTTARGGGPGTVDIGTSEETIDFGDITPGYVYMKNLDPTNYVSYGNATGDLDYLLEAGGGVGLVKMAGSTTLYMQANTAACKVQIIAFNS
jgi:hypothetical protein